MTKLIVHLSDSYIIEMNRLSKAEQLALRKSFTKKNPQFYKLRSLGYPTHNMKAQINLFDIRGNAICLPRGNLELIENLLPDKELEIVDERILVPLDKDIQFKKGFKFWTEQKKAIESAVIQEQGLIQGECGSGKTEILLGIFAELGQRTLVVVDKLELMKQWVKRIKERFDNVEVKTIGAGKWAIGDLTIGSQKTLYKHASKLQNKFGAILCDECIAGDSILRTDKGLICIEDFLKRRCSKVLTQKNNSIMMSDVSEWQCKGEREILQIETEKGIIKCTPEHLIKTQERGWVRADQLRLRESLYSVSADVAEKFSSIRNGTIKSKEKRLGKTKVYDITVPETHCFFANGLLVHNCHHFAAPTFQELISKIPARFRIGATATLARKDRKEFLVYAAFGKVLHSITDADLKEEGKIFEIEMIVVPTDFECASYVDIRKDKLSNEDEIIGYNYHALLTQMKVDELRNQLILKFIERNVKRGHKCLVMADRIAHCIYIRRLLQKRGIKTGLMVGEKEYEQEREQAPSKIKSGEISCIVVSPLVQEGFDLPELDRGFIINPSANNEAKLKQQSGRIKRIAKGKKSAKVYYFWDRKVHGFKAHLRKIQKLFPSTKVYVKR